MQEHIQARLERLRLEQSLETNHIIHIVKSAVIEEYQYLLDYLKERRPQAL